MKLQEFKSRKSLIPQEPIWNMKWMLTLSGPRVFLTMCSGGPEIHLCFLQNFADKTTDGKIRFSVSFLVSFKRFFHEEFFGRKECFIQPNFPRAFLRWKNARRASDVYVRRWPHRGVTLMTYIYVVGTERVNSRKLQCFFLTASSSAPYPLTLEFIELVPS